MVIEQVIASNAPDAYREVLRRMRLCGYYADSEKGPVIAMPGPFILQVMNPMERVIMDPVRDANPWFHLMEFIWMMAGERDVKWLVQFNKNIGNYAEWDGTIYGAYGHRWRWMFGRDQLVYIYETLKEEPNSRRAVLQMWHAPYDYQPDKKDYPCNTHAYFRINKYHALDMTVCNRSNDVIWGMLGSNIVHMTLLQEMLANALGVAVGTYTVFSNNAHIYREMPRFAEIWEGVLESRDPYRGTIRVEPYWGVTSSDGIHTFLREATRFVRGKRSDYTGYFMKEVVLPMYAAWEAHACRHDDTARAILNEQMPTNNDWKMAALEWLDRRQPGAASQGLSATHSAPLAPAGAPVVQCTQPGGPEEEIPF